MKQAVAVVTDSTAQLGHGIAGLHVVPIAIVLDGVAQPEGAVPFDEVYDLLAGGSEATTATPGPGAFAALYERLVREGVSEIVSIHVDGRLSGVVGAARIAAAEARAVVHVVDSGQVSYGLGLCALAVRRALDDGEPAAVAVEHAHALGAGLANASFVSAPGSDRIAAAHALVEVAGGETVVLSRPVAVADAATLLAARVSGASPLAAAVGHAASSARQHADELAALLAGREDVVDVVRYRVGPSVGAHTGGDSFGCYWWPARARPLRSGF